MSLPNLEIVQLKLKASRGKRVRGSEPYSVPPLWNDSAGRKSSAGAPDVDPREFYSDALAMLRKERAVHLVQGAGGEWSRRAVIYNMFVRSTCAFDHNQNGRLDLPLNAEGWRETGTFLKALSLLRYVRALGANVIHLLPITSIGSDGNKGTLGSPYAIRNPYHLDPNLAEPNLGLTVDDEFRAFVEAAHHLGIRVVVEFVFRTSAKDGDWVKEHPEWYYWIKESARDRAPGGRDESSYGSPLFTEEEMRTILKSVSDGNLGNLPPPHREYRDLFTEPPREESVEFRDGRYIGVLPEHTAVRIPGAFADWPPDDSQPPWGDVTFLKMYDHQDFNYIAYNTIRMYDTRLARPELVNKGLWQRISDIIPYYQKAFGIDGVMIDMGHALPMELKKEMIRKARSIDPDFAFWDENFSVEEQSVKEGYNAVIGYQWSDQHKPEKFKALIRRFAAGEFPLPFFATPESHNTPRAASRPGGTLYSRYAWAVSNFIPAIPFVHSGFELGETTPVNTGLDFTPDQLSHYPSHTLPLFSEYAYSWLNKDELTGWVARVSKARKKHEEVIIDPKPESVTCLNPGNDNIICFLRSSSKVKYQLLVIANSSMSSSEAFTVPISGTNRILLDELSGAKFKVRAGIVSGRLEAGHVVVAEV
jgi:hypothetical protein